MKERVVAFVVARLSSSRLPKKHLRMIGNKRLMDWTIENVKQSRLVDKIVIATTDEKYNETFVAIAKEHDIDIFLYKGDINDVVGRLAKAAEEYEADIPILISGDCPLIWAESLDSLIKKALNDKEIDAVDFCLKNGIGPIHEGMGVYRKKCWKLADKISDKPNLREHQFPIINLRPKLFKKACVYDDELFYGVKHRVSVDTLADLEFMNVLYDELKAISQEFNMPNVVRLLMKKPEIMEINRDVHQIKIDEKQKKAVFIIKNEDKLELFFDIAYDMTKRGIGVRFFLPNKDIVQKIEKKGFGVTNTTDGFDFKIEETT